MRVIAGLAKGRKLTAPAGRRLRPSGDRLKEALFSSIGPKVEGAAVLDLFAGTGALGIEALSRGAAAAVFVDEDRDAVESVRANLDHTGLTASATVVREDVERFLMRAAPEPFDLVLIDPPYEVGLPSDVLKSLLEGGFITPGSTVVVEVSSREPSPDAPSGFSLESRRRYGDSALLYLKAQAL